MSSSSIDNANHEQPETAQRPTERRHQLAAIGIGNFLEWFDFAIYGYFAAVIGSQFFPTGNPTTEILSSFAVFAVGFLSRPFGAFILGPIGDKHGRKIVLFVTVLGMGTVTALIGLIPSFHQIGIIAPIAVVVLRLLQGAFAGSEWTSAATYIGEVAPSEKRAVYASVITGTAALAFLSGTISAAFLSGLLTGDSLYSWGWRIPFVASIIMAVIAVYIRRRLEDTPVFETLEKRRANNLVKPISTKQKLKAFVMTLAFSGVFGVSLYYLITYMNNFLSGSVGMNRFHALLICSIATAFYVAFNPLAGFLTDKFGRRPVLYTALIGLILWSLPAFLLMSTGNFFFALFGMTGFAFFVACSAVVNNVLLVEVFPASIRATGSAIGYNVAYAALAGPGPFIATFLVNTTGVLVSPSFYIICVCCFALIVLFPLLEETKGVDINQG
ncbi:MHS family proline/betaine transporter-like MFS transporter [Brevibacterium paucivorans]|uniref:MHS family proline/betaine transporter-like MFS transporter n=1 Tax=Brevibacterium paucivorans TaxID=170994 RepID=A0ABS2SND2_9MICO|nr:MFS transporter [Brevibacterium paucivorans]MBM7817489.1 MHS family proline/betaine transporter-like MFS transporter [Brevibacterium paucivorans]